MNTKKIIIPTDLEVKKYSNDKDKIKILHPDPLEHLNIKELNKEIKNKGKFCSTIKIILDWKDIVKDALNNTDYKNDKR